MSVQIIVIPGKWMRLFKIRKCPKVNVICEIARVLCFTLKWNLLPSQRGVNES